MCSCENAKKEPSLLERIFFYVLGSSYPAPKTNSYTMRHGEILYMQLNNAMFIYFKMCSICKFFTIIVENISVSESSYIK